MALRGLLLLGESLEREYIRSHPKARNSTIATTFWHKFAPSFRLSGEQEGAKSHRRWV